MYIYIIIICVCMYICIYVLIELLTACAESSCLFIYMLLRLFILATCLVSVLTILAQQP